MLIPMVHATGSGVEMDMFLNPMEIHGSPASDGSFSGRLTSISHGLAGVRASDAMSGWIQGGRKESWMTCVNTSIWANVVLFLLSI